MEQISPIQALLQQRTLLQLEYYTEKEAFRKLTEQMGMQRKVKRGDAWFPLQVGKSFYNSLNQTAIEVFRTSDQDIEHNFEFGRPVMFFRSEERRVKSEKFNSKTPSNSSSKTQEKGQENSSLFTHHSSLKYFSFTGTVSYVDGDRMVITVPDSAPLLELQQSTDPIGVQLSFDETSYKLMFEALDRVMKAKNNRLAYLRDLFYSHQKAGRFSFEPMKFPWLNPTQERAVNEVLWAKDVAIVHGPPGTGKTLLAKAIAGEAGVPFFSISGSDFVEMFVGVGASRVRDLFEEAKKNAPCIVFIDEIDAVARRRGTGMGGGHDEREQTLNQLLVEMDGFGVNEGIIVMAATNRVDILDPAIMRPGRFDRKVHVGRPDVGGREEILKVHIKNKPLGDDVDIKQIAQTTAGFTGADLENLLNEAAIVAAREDRAYIKQEDIRRSFVKVGIGAEKKSRIISDKEKRITAFHEAGHAILFHVLPDVGPVYSISIIPTGAGAAGYTMPLPEKDEMFNSRGRMLQEITVDLGGRVAEEIVFDDITTGASQDIKQATAMAKAMVTKYGMSENVGLINYDNEDDEVFIGRDLAHTRGYGESVATKIDQEIKHIIDECYAKAKAIIKEHEDVLNACADLLIEKEKITREEFEALFEPGEGKNPL